MTIATFRSSSSDSIYEVKSGNGGVFYCSCMGWKTSKHQPKTCRHMKELVDAGTLAPDHTLAGGAGSAPPKPSPLPPAPVTSKKKPDLMLAHQIEKAPVSPWGSGEWVAEAKYDGFRLAVVSTGDRTVQYSRLGNLHDHEFLSRLRLPQGTILDGEMTSGGEASSYAQGASQAEQFVLFDVMRIGDVDLTSRTWTERRMALELLHSKLDEPRIVASRVLGIPDQNEADAMIDDGCEGVMVKRRSSTYQPRRSWDWLKYKGTASYDVYAIDMEGECTADDRKLAGWKNIRYAVKVDGILTVVGSLGVTGLPSELEKYVGRVLEIKGYGQSARGAIRHPVFLRVRDDLSIDDCVVK